MKLQYVELKVGYGGKMNVGNYNNVSFDCELTARLGKDDNIDDALAEMWRKAKAVIREQATEAAERNGLVAPRTGSDQAEEEGSANYQRNGNPPMQAQTLNELITPKQLHFIRNLGRELGIDMNERCKELFQVELESLSKRGASMLIDRIKTDAERSQAKTEEEALSQLP
jgi:hypothetical protein